MIRNVLRGMYIAVLILGAVATATMFGVFIPAGGESNTAEMTYGGSISISLVSSQSTQTIDAQDPNYIIITTVIRQRIIER